MRHSPLSRRLFLKTTSSGILSLLAFGVQRKDGDVSATSVEPAKGFDLRLDSHPGFYSIFFDNRPFVQHAFLQIETEEETVRSFDARFTAREHREKGEIIFTFTDRKGVLDVQLRSAIQESGVRLIFGCTLFNRSNLPLRIKNVFPLLASMDHEGSLSLWNDLKNLRLLTDEWERCYGCAGVRQLTDRNEFQSAWDIHLLDTTGQRHFTASFFEVPNIKLSFTARRTDNGQKLDFIVRADTHAGTRGVLLNAGASFTLTELMLRVTTGSPFDTLETYARLIAGRNKVPMPRILPTGWVDWYFAKAKTTEQDVLENLNFIARELRDFGLEYVQLDSGWQLGVETTPPPHNVIAGGPWVPNSKFPRGMKWYADEIKKRGLKPGIWVRPFHIIDGAKERSQHPEWFNERGQMDFSNPGVHEHVRGLFQMLTEEWGYEYVKFDFPSYDLFGDWGPKLFEDHSAQKEINNPSVTNVEAYRRSLEAIREAVADKAHLLACNSVMPQTLGLADVFRIGDDVGDWGRTFQYGVKSVAARYYTNGSYWTNDPDCLLVREPFTVDQAKMWASLIALSGGVIFISEYLPKLPAERLAILKKAMPVYRNEGESYAFGRPVDLLENDPPHVWNLEVKRVYATWNVVGVFNWSEREMANELSFSALGLSSEVSYSVFDFWGNEYLGEQRHTLRVKLKPMSCKVFAIHKAQPHPQVLSTTRHITQGGVELLQFRWEPVKGTLFGLSHVIKNNPYEIILRVPAGFRITHATGGEVLGSSRKRVARLKLLSPETKKKEWRVEFERV